MKNKFLTLFLIVSALSLSACNLSGANNKDSNQDEVTNNNKPEEPKEDFIDVYPNDNNGGNNNEPPEENNNGEEEPNNNEENNGGEEPVVNPPEVVTLSSISITPPSKIVYEVGDKLDLTGLTIIAHYSDESSENISISDVNITGYDMSKQGEQTVTVSYENKTESFKITVLRKYDEDPDSLEGVNTSDLSALYNAFTTPILNYTSKTESYFNKDGAYDYYRHYQKNYVQEKTNIYTTSAQYSYPKLNDYLGVLNIGYLNLNNNYYSYSLTGEDVTSRLASSLTSNDLSLVKENASYQDDLFTLGDLNQTYFENNEFVRVSANKYQSTKGKDTYADFIDICAPHLINNGYYMTFSKVTIELNPFDGVSMRIRLYASPTQRGKLEAIYKDEENRPNWYLLFSEALIYDVNNTSFHPMEGLL